MTLDEFNVELVNLLSKIAKTHVSNDGAMCTNFVVVAELLDSNGEYWMFASRDESKPPWTHRGLLYQILESDVENPESEDYDG